jgi:hypothetical protein
MTAAEIGTIAANAGFTGDDLVTAVAVAMAESSGNPNDLGDIGIGQGSFGLWQISSRWHPEYGPDFTQLYDPQTNANAAFAIYSAAGNSFSPWSTFKSGAYKANLQVALAQLSQFVSESVQAVSDTASQAASDVGQVVSDNPASSAGLLILAVVLLFMFSGKGK